MTGSLTGESFPVEKFHDPEPNPATSLAIGSIFDYTMFFVMLYVFHCWDPSRASVFQTGWFVESLMTQTLIIHVIRSNKIPFLQSRAS